MVIKAERIGKADQLGKAAGGNFPALLSDVVSGVSRRVGDVAAI
jgi:hypothetical protein